MKPSLKAGLRHRFAYTVPTSKTVPRLYPTIRPGARYYQSLRLLDTVKRLAPSVFTKSGLSSGVAA